MTSKERFALLKCAEELNELATVILQHVNKPNKDLTSRIAEELKDVKLRFRYLNKYIKKK